MRRNHFNGNTTNLKKNNWLKTFHDDKNILI